MDTFYKGYSIQILSEVLQKKIVDFESTVNRFCKTKIEEIDKRNKIKREQNPIQIDPIPKIKQQYVCKDSLEYYFNRIINTSIYVKSLLNILIYIEKCYIELDQLDEKSIKYDENGYYVFMRMLDKIHKEAELFRDTFHKCTALFTNFDVHTDEFLKSFNLTFDQYMNGSNYLNQSVDTTIPFQTFKVDEYTSDILGNIYQYWKKDSTYKKSDFYDIDIPKYWSDTIHIEQLFREKICSCKFYIKLEIQRFFTSPAFLENICGRTLFVLPQDEYIKMSFYATGFDIKEKRIYSKPETEQSRDETIELFTRICEYFDKLEREVNLELLNINDFKDCKIDEYIDNYIQYNKKDANKKTSKKLEKVKVFLADLQRKEKVCRIIMNNFSGIQTDKSIGMGSLSIAEFVRQLYDIRKNYSTKKESIDDEISPSEFTNLLYFDLDDPEETFKKAVLRLGI